MRTHSIEAVIICKDYADFLEHTLPDNINQLDRIVVVTSPDDKATQGLCSKYSVECIETEVFTESDGDVFNKGKAINVGLMYLRHEGWLLHIDADIILPHGFRNRIRQAQLNPERIYGADRFNIRGYEQYEKIRDQLKPQFQWRYMITPPPPVNQSMGARLLHNEFGYCPMGFFQLWNANTKRRYPALHGSAEHEDVMFALQWARDKRQLLPEFFVFHLESEDAKFGSNWLGRRTAPFKPKPPHHDPHHHHHPYCPPHHHHHKR